MDRLQRLLRDFTNVTVVERRFDTGDGIEGLGDNPFVCSNYFTVNCVIVSFLQVPNTRVFVLSMFPENARAMLCKVYRMIRMPNESSLLSLKCCVAFSHQKHYSNTSEECDLPVFLKNVIEFILHFS